MSPNFISGLEGPVPLFLVKGCILATPEAQITRELDEVFLNQKGHHLKITNDLPAKFIVIRCTQKDFDILVLFFLCALNELGELRAMICVLQ